MDNNSFGIRYLDGDQQRFSNTNTQGTLWVPKHGDSHIWKELQGPERQEMRLETRQATNKGELERNNLKAQPTLG